MREVVGGAVVLAIAGLYYWGALGIRVTRLDDDFGPRGLPIILAVLLAVVGTAILVRGLLGLRTRRDDAEANDEEGDDKGAPLPRALGFLAIGVGYLLVIEVVGYAIAIALMIGAVAVYEGARRDWRIPAAAVGGGTLFFLLFHTLLGVAEPGGMLF